MTSARGKLAKLRLLYADEEAQHHVLFLHGLGGGPGTWMSSGCSAELWPVWLHDDLPHVSIWAVEYPAARTLWSGWSMPIVDRAENILALLKAEPRLRTGEISFIGYSFGGLVAKQILRVAQTKGPQDQAVASLSQRVRRVGFLAKRAETQ